MKLNLSLGALALIQLSAGLASQLIVLGVLGPGIQTDAFVAAQAVPAVVFAILAVSLQNVWQPRLAVLSDDHHRWRDTQGVAQGQVLLLFGATAIALIVTARWWVQLLFPGFSSEQWALTAYLAQILLFSMVLNGHAALLTTAERARNRFVAAEGVSSVAAIAAVAALPLLLPKYGIAAAAWVTLVRAVVVAAILYALSGRPAVLIGRAWREAPVWQQLRPMLAGSSIYKTGPLVDRFWSSFAAPGGVTAFNLAQVGMGAVATVLDRAISVPMAPQLARLVAGGDFAGVRRVYRACVTRITVLVGLLMLALLLLKPFWNSLTLLLRMDEPLSSQLWLICFLLLGYVHVAASGTIAIAAFHAFGDARTPVKVGVLGFAIGIVLKSLAFFAWGLTGLALGTSIYYVMSMLLMCVLLEKKINEHLS